MAPIPTGFIKNGVIQSSNIEFYKKRAKDIGLIIAGAININHPTASNSNKIPYISNKCDIDMWKNITSNVHEENCKIFAQLWHSGSTRVLTKKNNFKNFSSPSGIVNNKKLGSPLKVSEIKNIIYEFVKAANHAYKAEFDGIEIHACHGSLLHDFLTLDSNYRTDQYGIENRTQLIEEIINGCRETVGNKFLISIRLSNFKMYNLEAKLTNNIQELRDLIRPINNSGINIFDISDFNYSYNNFYGENGNLANWIKRITSKTTISTGSFGNSNIFINDIPNIINELTYKPKLNYPHLQSIKPEILNEKLIYEDLIKGEIDLIALGRPLLFNYNWVKEMRLN